MTPAEMREAAAALVERCEWYATASLGRLAAAIRALPLAEEAPTPREKLRRVREAREVLATARVAFVRRGEGAVSEAVVNAATGANIAITKWALRWSDLRGWLELKDRTVYQSEEHADWRTWVLDTLRAEGWDVVEEGDGDG